MIRCRFGFHNRGWDIREVTVTPTSCGVPMPSAQYRTNKQFGVCTRCGHTKVKGL